MGSGWWCGTFHFFATITTKKAGRNFISSCFFHLLQNKILWCQFLCKVGITTFVKSTFRARAASCVFLDRLLPEIHILVTIGGINNRCKKHSYFIFITRPRNPCSFYFFVSNSSIAEYHIIYAKLISKRLHVRFFRQESNASLIIVRNNSIFNHVLLHHNLCIYGICKLELIVFQSSL